MQCRSCLMDKQADDFYKSNQTRCKECIKASVRRNRIEKIEYYRAYDRQRGSRPDRVAARDAEIAMLRGLMSEMADNDTYDTEHDGRMYSICHGCGAQDGEDHRRDDCVYVRARSTLSGVSMTDNPSYCKKRNNWTGLRAALDFYDDDPTSTYARDCFYANVDSDTIRALLAERDALIAALEALMGEQSGGPKPCGHEYECVCAGTLLLAALAQGEV